MKPDFEASLLTGKLVENLRIRSEVQRLDSGRLFAAGHDHLAGAHGLDDVELREHGHRGVDLRAVAVDHDDHGGGREVHGLAIEVLADLQCTRAFLGRAEQLG